MYPRIMFCFALLCSSFAVPALRAELPDLSPAPAGGEPLLADSPRRGFSLEGQAAADAHWTDLPNGWRLETAGVVAPATVEWRALSIAPVAQGDVGWLRFRARCPASKDETGGRLRILVQTKMERTPSSMQVERAQKSLVHELNLSPEWREYALPYVCKQTLPAGELELVINFGHTAQTVEITDLVWLGYGRRVAREALPRSRFTYEGRAADATWRTEAHARIERLRQGNFTVKVVDAQGQPVVGARVNVALQRHAFGFGTAVKMDRLIGTSPDDQRYRDTLLGWFSAAGPDNDLKWPYWTKDTAVYRREVTLAGLRWLKEQGIPARGHVLVWPSWPRIPADVAKLRGTPRQDEIPGLVREHIKEILTTTRGLLTEWDVLNEPYTHHDLMDMFGPQIAADWFKVAREVGGPDMPLYLNDFGNHDQDRDPQHVAHFEQTVRALQAAGAPLDGLGLQAHFGTQVTPPARLLATLDRLAALGLPMRITEFDVTTDDEELQADYLRDALIAVFSHPSMVGFQMWGFWESVHWRPEAAMFRADWSERPQAEAYRKLVLQQWRTKLEGKSGAEGQYAGRGFYGEYDVEVNAGDGRSVRSRFSLHAGSAAAKDWTVILK